jgi:hypothetical protein
VWSKRLSIEVIHQRLLVHLRARDWGAVIALMASSPYAADIAYYLGIHKQEAHSTAAMSMLDHAGAIKEIERKAQSSIKIER